MPRVVSKDTESMVDLQGWVDKNLETGLVPAIFDRHRLISETIYGPVLREEPQPGFARLDWLGPRMARFYELEPLIIYCMPSFRQVCNNLKNDPDNKAVVQHIGQIYQGYTARVSLDLKFAPRRPLVWNYNTTKVINDLPVWMPKVDQYINEISGRLSQ